VTEQQKYRVVKRLGDLEIREYEACVLMQVTVAGDFMRAGNMAFGPLVRFISGANAAGQKIAMTAPVIQEPVNDQEHIVSFVLPAGMHPDDVPVPSDARVKMVAESTYFAAARKFGGGWNEHRFISEGEQLLNAVKAAGLEPIGAIYWARFDPPWKPGFLKRNEAIIKIERPKAL
jgi:hypothetical protein